MTRFHYREVEIIIVYLHFFIRLKKMISCPWGGSKVEEKSGGGDKSYIR